MRAHVRVEPVRSALLEPQNILNRGQRVLEPDTDLLPIGPSDAAGKMTAVPEAQHHVVTIYGHKAIGETHLRSRRREVHETAGKGTPLGRQRDAFGVGMADCAAPIGRLRCRAISMICAILVHEVAEPSGALMKSECPDAHAQSLPE